MTTLAEQMTADLETLFNADEFAKEITYGGATITAIVDYAKSGDDPAASRQSARITVKASDVPIPALRTEVVIDGVTWLTAEPGEAQGDGLAWTIPLTRDERARMR